MKARLAAWSDFAAAALAAGYFATSAAAGLSRVEFGDETEKLVAALMQRDGGKLYRDVFTHHGPLSYVAPQLLVRLLGPERGLPATRLAVVALTLAAAIAIAGSPALSRPASRALAGAVFLGLLAPAWLLQALNLGLYHNLAGALAVVVLALVVVPAIVGAPIGRGAALLGGLAAGLVPFAAYSHGPAMVLFALGALVGSAGAGGGRARAAAAPFVLGALLGALAVVAWLAAFGDLRRFVVYGFLFNQRIYAGFIGYDFTLPLRSLAPPLNAETAYRALSVALGALGLSAIAWRGRRPAALAGVLLVALGLLMLDPRGGFGFAANALLLGAFGVAALGLGLAADAERASRGRLAGAIAAAAAVLVAGEGVSRVAVSSPNAQSRRVVRRHQAIFGETDGPRERLVRALADPGERVQALVYRPHFYLETGRLPAAAQYYYLPWQAEYERRPVPGYETDLCRELRDAAPPVILFDDWLVWERWRFAEYAPCLAALLDERYAPLAVFPELRVRKDRLAERRGVVELAEEPHRSSTQ